jgi:hypothetical protein
MQSVIIEPPGSGHMVVFLSDLAFFHWQLERLAWVSAYDLDPMTTIETKRRWQPWLVERQAAIFFQHDPLVAAGVLREQEGRYSVDPIIAPPSAPTPE